MLIIIALLLLSISPSPTTSTPAPTPWPPQFHSIAIFNSSGTLHLVDLWYDWPNGRNFNIIRDQLASNVRYALEWNNGTSFYYTLDSTNKCQVIQFDVGVLPPDWLRGANYLGQKHFDGFLCHEWEKADFLWYYEDVVTHRPVYWLFYTGMGVHVMTFEVGAALEDAKWQAPEYCFGNNNGEPYQTLSLHPRRKAGFPGGFMPASWFDKYV